MKSFIRLTLLVLILSQGNMLFSQFFKAGIIGGLNTAQIDGDGHAGYDKFGLTGGLRTSFPLQKKSRLGLEFLYSQRGSQSRVVKGVPKPVERIHLDYIEIPVFFQYNDWWIDEPGYFKVRAEGGLSYAYLMNVRTTNTSPTFNDGEGFNKNDVSFFMGIGYQFNKHWAIQIRYTRSLFRLYTLDLPGEPNYPYLLGYFLSFRTEYYF